MRLNKRIRIFCHTMLLIVFLSLSSAALGQLGDVPPICTGMSCLSNADCGVGCVCANGMCYSVDGGN